MLAKYRYFQWVFTLLFIVASNSFAGGWEQVTELPILRVGNAAAAVDGKIYIIGGYDRHKNLGGRAPALCNSRCLRHADEHMAYSRKHADPAGCRANGGFFQRNLRIWGL